MVKVVKVLLVDHTSKELLQGINVFRLTFVGHLWRIFCFYHAVSQQVGRLHNVKKY